MLHHDKHLHVIDAACVPAMQERLPLLVHVSQLAETLHAAELMPYGHGHVATGLGATAARLLSVSKLDLAASHIAAGLLSLLSTLQAQQHLCCLIVGPQPVVRQRQ